MRRGDQVVMEAAGVNGGGVLLQQDGRVGIQAVQPCDGLRSQAGLPREKMRRFVDLEYPDRLTESMFLEADFLRKCFETTRQLYALLGLVPGGS